VVTVLTLLSSVFIHWFGMWIFVWVPFIEIGRALTTCGAG